MSSKRRKDKDKKRVPVIQGFTLTTEGVLLDLEATMISCLGRSCDERLVAVIQSIPRRANKRAQFVQELYIDDKDDVDFSIRRIAGIRDYQEKDHKRISVVLHPEKVVRVRFKNVKDR